MMIMGKHSRAFKWACPWILLMAMATSVNAQRSITVFDFEAPLTVKGWWVDNKDIMLTQCDSPACQQLPGSGKCLRIEWDQVPENRPNTWLTDIKIDTFGNPAMEGTWKDFRDNAWLSLMINTAGGDSVYLQFIVFTKGEKDKWGSQETIGFKSAAWTMVKIRLSSLHFDNWGKGTVANPDFNSIVPARMEVGIRSPRADKKAKIDLRLDNLRITNYEP